MSEENKEGGNGQVNPALEQPEEFKIVITKNFETGRLDIQAPGNGQLYNQYICVGMLDDAKDFIKAHNRRAMQSKITSANPSMAQQVRGLFKRR